MKISQAKAKRLKHRVAELEAKFASICDGCPGTTIGTWAVERDWFLGRIEMAKSLGCAILVTVENKVLYFRAVKPL